MTTDEKLDLLINKVSALESDIQNVKQDMQNVKQDMQNVKQDMQNVKQEQIHTQAILENVIDRCVKVLGEGYQMTYEKIDRLNLDSFKSKITQLEMIELINRSDIQELKKKIS